jgi:hypothetical protein
MASRADSSTSFHKPRGTDRRWDEADPTRERLLNFELTPEEEPYARVLAAEIERTFGYEPLPPEIGKEVVPDVATKTSGLGESTIYDCLFTGHW